MFSLRILTHGNEFRRSQYLQEEISVAFVHRVTAQVTAVFLTTSADLLLWDNAMKAGLAEDRIWSNSFLLRNT